MAAGRTASSCCHVTTSAPLAAVVLVGLGVGSGHGDQAVPASTLLPYPKRCRVLRPPEYPPTAVDCRVTRVRAWNSTSPPLPIAGARLTDILDPRQYERIVDARDVFGGEKAICADRLDKGGTFLPPLPNNTLDALAGRGGAVALAFSHDRQTPALFGHVHTYILAFFCTLAAPRTGGRWKRRLTVYLPSAPRGPGRSALQELPALFGGDEAGLGLTFESAPWVPLCVSTCCMQYGGLPPALRGRVTLLAGLKNGPFFEHSAVTASLRAHARPMLLRSPSARAKLLGRDDAPILLFVRSARWPNRRRLLREPIVEKAVRAWAARTHPGLQFVGAHVHELPLRHEFGLFARARAVISLFGSSLHLCRYMAPGSVVIELHGALHDAYGDTALFTVTCAIVAGQLHAPLGVPGAMPGRFRRYAPETESGDHAAALEPKLLLDLLDRVLPAEGSCARVDWLRVLSDYERWIEAQLHPLSRKKLPALPFPLRAASLPSVYRQALRQRRPRGCT